MKILWITFVWPEPESSAAGFRTMQLLSACKDAGHQVHVSSPCQPNAYQERLSKLGYPTIQLLPNDDQFDHYIKEYQPDVVYFDRFMIEEQFGWRVREHCPHAARILDTIDLHSLRRTREKKVKQSQDVFALSPSELQSDDAMREIAAIYRSDLSLLVSDAEIALLKQHYNIPEELITLSRFFYSDPDGGLEFDDRQHFMMIGNINHAPNIDAFRLLKGSLWKKVRDSLEGQGHTGVELHLYGAYPNEEFKQLADPRLGIIVKGWAADARKALSSYRVNLAPLRFGAGIKGKVSDGWAEGTPCVGTSIAAEGMHGELPFGGMIQDNWELFAQDAALLYSDRKKWEIARSNSINIIQELYNSKLNTAEFLQNIEIVSADLSERRQRNFIGAMLWYHHHRSTEYFSRWIEAKNKVLAK